MRYIVTIICLMGFLFTNVTLAEQMDAKLNMAKRSLATIETKLNNIKRGDVNEYNRLTKQLDKAAGLLKSTESKAHPDYYNSVQQYTALYQSMINMAQDWQSNQPSNSTSKVDSSVANNQSITEQTSAVVDANAILVKYQKEGRPTLGNYPNPSDVKQWAQKMRSLMSTELQQDLALLKQPNVAASDAERVSRWIGGEFQQQIQQDVRSRLQSFNSIADTAAQLASQINKIQPNDKMRVFNFANGENGQTNYSNLEKGLVASANAMAIEEVFPKIADPNRQAQVGVIALAQQNFSDMREQAKQTATELANMPKKQKPKKQSVGIKGIEQELWLNGRRLAHLDKKGSIWMNSSDVGDITGDGTIWVRSSDLGSIEADGKVWFRGRHIGTLEENGRVWRNSSHVGTIDSDGKVWISSSATGEIVPFNEEWKRAAIIYFFTDLFDE